MAAETMSLEQATRLREKQIEANRARGVIPWKNDFPQSEEVWEVQDGYHYVPAEPGAKEKLRLGAGNRFHPTVAQVESKALEGKARPLSATEMAGIGRSKDPSRKISVRGADIGLRQFFMADSTRAYAMEQGLTEQDFEGLEPDGSDGRFTRGFVEGLVADRAVAAARAADDE